MYIFFWHTDNICIDTFFGTMTTIRFWHIDAIPKRPPPLHSFRQMGQKIANWLEVFLLSKTFFSHILYFYAKIRKLIKLTCESRFDSELGNDFSANLLQGTRLRPTRSTTFWSTSSNEYLSCHTRGGGERRRGDWLPPSFSLLPPLLFHPLANNFA